MFKCIGVIAESCIHIFSPHSMYWLTITCVLSEAFIGYHIIDKGLHVTVLDGLQYFKMGSMVPGGILSCSTLPFKHDEMCL